MIKIVVNDYQLLLIGALALLTLAGYQLLLYNHLMDIQGSNQLLAFNYSGVGLVEGIYYGDGLYCVNAMQVKSNMDITDRHEYCHYLVDDFDREHFCG